LEQLIQFDWRLSMDGKDLSRKEVLAAARAQGGLVFLGGQWRRLTPTQRQAVTRLDPDAEEAAPEVAPLVHWLRWRAGQEETPLGLELAVDPDCDPLQEILEGLPKIHIPPSPEGLQATLRPYQCRGVAWLATLDHLGLGACLADDMGLGKTIQVLTLLLHERREKSGPLGPTLLICPTSLLGNWEHEAARFAPSLRLYTHHGPRRASGSDFFQIRQEHDLILTTYSLAGRDLELLGTEPWDRLVLDEAQNVKNPDTAQSRAIRKLQGRSRIALTGTPVENRLQELWSLMRFLNPGLLGSRRDFSLRFAAPIEKRGEDAPARKLRELTGPFLLRRKKTDPELIPELPEKFERTEYCHLTPEQAGLYQAEVERMMAAVEDAEGMARRGAVLASLTRLKQICNHPAQLATSPDLPPPSGDKHAAAAPQSPESPASEAPTQGLTQSEFSSRSGKIQRLNDLVAGALESGESLLCFTQYRRMGEFLQAHLKQHFGKDVTFLHGGVPRKTRDSMVANFQKNPGSNLMLLSLKAGGTGLNLTAANHVIHYDRWWNPAVEDQATDRTFRIGQTRNVMVHRLVCLGTLEEKIDRMLEEKRDLADKVVVGGEAWLTDLSSEELRTLVTLEPRT
jgi:non-specific serine/threonine protein kinase